LLRGKSKTKTQRFVQKNLSTLELTDLCAEIRRTSQSQARVLDCILKHPQGILLTELMEKAGVSKSPIDTLTKKNILIQNELTLDRSLLETAEFFPTRPKTLNQEQSHALDSITSDLDQKIFSPHLIHGITGSGKTEIYIQAITHALAQNLGVILLVPEIALTTQTIERLKSRIPQKIAILHHRLSDGERFDTWQNIRRGDIQLAVGARSALFSPIQNLGLIIIDEEQENSYKQTDEMPCYNARDVAIMRAKFSHATVLLGSATPSLESFHNAQIGKYKLHTLTTRATKAALPTVHVIDMKTEYEKNSGFTLFSQPLLSGIKERFQKGEQCLLFLNRRGYHPLRTCKSCGKTLKCPHCDITLTFHKTIDTLFCHTCSHSISPPPRTCPYCNAHDALQYKGAGTEQIERALHAIFPDIRTLRMDADTTRHKGAHDRLFKQFRAGKADVLIGTQMIAKGLHFPSVTLVGVLNSDSALNIPDFRASEQTFQLLAQVSGRSGRSELPGEVIIQTQLPDHPIIVHASTENYPLFFEEELSVRKLFDYPPLTRLARFIFSGMDEMQTQNAALTMRDELTKHLPPSLLLLPVTPCGCERIKKNYRYQFLVKGISLAPLHNALNKTPPSHRNVRMVVDIDPTSVYF
ncbi:MAG: primosomal protein N', partial [Chlamydiia bacterium]|nr:primosomal protein N' [Chlamydiia bacterium]